MSLYHLIYQSRARQPFDARALAALLQQARVGNRRRHITGLLLHTAGQHFLQVLEGEEAEVRSLYYEHIRPDPRHRHCAVLAEGPCAHRSFADWNMGCRRAGPAELGALLAEAARTPARAGAGAPPVSPALLQGLFDFVADTNPAA